MKDKIYLILFVILFVVIAMQQMTIWNLTETVNIQNRVNGLQNQIIVRLSDRVFGTNLFEELYILPQEKDSRINQDEET